MLMGLQLVCSALLSSHFWVRLPQPLCHDKTCFWIRLADPCLHGKAHSQATPGLGLTLYHPSASPLHPRTPSPCLPGLERPFLQRERFAV